MNVKADDYTSDEDIKAIAILPIKETLILQEPIETLALHPKDFDNELLFFNKNKIKKGE